jgi:hypothetical protein
MDWGAWIALAGFVVTACFGTITVVFSRRAQRALAVAHQQAEVAHLQAEQARSAARDSAEAAQRSADAQRAIARLLEKSQAKLVLIEPDEDMNGKRGLVLRNNSEASIFKVEVKPCRDSADLWGWNAQGLPEKIGKTLVADSLKSGEATRVWVPALNQERLAIDHICVTFDDASGKSWRRAGNAPPVNE